MQSRTIIKAAIEKALRNEFPHDTVDISDGFRDNIHVLVVSRRFDEKDDKHNSDWLQTIITKDAGLIKEEQELISLIIPVSPSELK